MTNTRSTRSRTCSMVSMGVAGLSATAGDAPSLAKSAGRTDGAIEIERGTSRTLACRTVVQTRPGSVAAMDLQTTAVAKGGEAIARDPSGRVVFVEGALPGETVAVEIIDE